MSSKKTSPAGTVPVAPVTYSWLPDLLILLVAVGLYVNTLGHDYALDDAIVITNNDYTKEGFKGLDNIFTTDAFQGFFGAKKDLVEGGRYRPLSIATFAVEQAIFGGKPGISHFINMLLYGLLGMVTYRWLRQILGEGDRRSPWYMAMPFVVTLLFMAHPIHTEVVANIKGRDEIMAMLFTMLALVGAFKYVDTGKWLWQASTFICIFLALLSKETPLPFLLILPVAIYVFRKDTTILRGTMATMPLWAGTIIYLVMRFAILGFGTGTETEQGTEILNDPFLNSSAAERTATVLETWLYYYGKLLVPINLSHDYYFNQIPVTNFSNPIVLGSGLLTAALFALGAYLTYKRKAAGFGLLFFFLSFSITSNLVISIGTTMGERFVFLPSLGFCLALVVGLEWALRFLTEKNQAIVFYTVVGICLLFSLKTVTRNVAWTDNYSLFTTDVETCPNSAKLQTAAGGSKIDRAEEKGTNPTERDRLLREAIEHLQKAVTIYPEHGNAWLLMGNARHKVGDYAGSLQAYEKCMLHRPLLWDAYSNAAVTARKMGRYDIASSYYRNRINLQPLKGPALTANIWFDYANNFEEWGNHPDSSIWAYNKAIALDPKMAPAYGQMGRVYGMQKGDMANAISFGEKALSIDPQLDWVYENVGIAHAMKGDPASAIATFQRGLARFPNSAKLHKNIGIAYQSIGDVANAQASFAKAKQLAPNMQ